MEEFHKSKQYVREKIKREILPARECALTFFLLLSQTWIVDGQEVGSTQRGGGLTWATVEGAGKCLLLCIWTIQFF